jgi:hypothetical protein
MIKEDMWWYKAISQQINIVAVKELTFSALPGVNSILHITEDRALIDTFHLFSKL